MAKRTSWEQENKHIHKSRKKIIDTVFGREDNNQTTFGYEGEADVKHELGEIWTDKDGKTWQQRDGYKISVTKFDELREYLKTITTCSGKECHTEKYNHIDKKLIAKTTMCLDCLQKYEAGLKADGTWPFYEDYKLTCNKLAFANEMKDKYEGAHRDITNSIEMVNEDGTISEWKWDIDINTVKADIQRDLDNVVDSIKKLKSRKRRLEKKLKELGHAEIINK